VRVQAKCRSILAVYSKVSIKHFRGFEDLATDLAPVTLVSGRNNTGKTALLEALFLHASGPGAAQNALAALRPARGQGVILGLNSSSGTTVWDSLFTNHNTRIAVEIVGRFDDQDVKLQLTSIRATGGGVDTTQTAGLSGEGYSQSIKVTFKRGTSRPEEYVQSAIQQTFPQQAPGPFNVQFGGIGLQLQPPAQPFLPGYYISARTRASQAELAARYSDLRVQGRGKDLLNAVRVIEPRLKGLEVLVTDGQATLHADIGEPDLLPITLFGEGMTAIIEYIGTIYGAKDGIVLIDEIENGIHYSVLKDMWSHIKRAAEGSHTQIVATTHSHECVAAAESVFTRQPGLFSLLRLFRSHDGVSVRSYDSRTLEQALDMNLDVR
jgi:predicted ATPase